MGISGAARHGVIGNNYFDRQSETAVPFIPDPLFDKDEIVKVPTVYDAAHKAGLVTARALSFRTAAVSREQQSDFAAIDKAVLAIEKHASNLNQIHTSAQTIINSAKRVKASE